MVSVRCNRPKIGLRPLWHCLFPQHLLNSLPCRAFFRDTIEETYNNGPPLTLYPKKRSHLP